MYVMLCYIIILIITARIIYHIQFFNQSMLEIKKFMASFWFTIQQEP